MISERGQPGGTLGKNIMHITRNNFADGCLFSVFHWYGPGQHDYP